MLHTKKKLLVSAMVLISSVGTVSSKEFSFFLINHTDLVLRHITIGLINKENPLMAILNDETFAKPLVIEPKTAGKVYMPDKYKPGSQYLAQIKAVGYNKTTGLVEAIFDWRGSSQTTLGKEVNDLIHFKLDRNNAFKVQNASTGGLPVYRGEIEIKN